MRRHHGVAALVLIGWCLSAAASGRQSQDPTIITGQVRIARPDGNPAASVDVWASHAISGAEVARARTSQDGRFTLRVPPGRYMVFGARSGFITTAFGSVHDGLPGVPVIAAPGGAADLALVIRRGAAVRGTVRDDSGNPVRDAQVIFLAKVPGEGLVRRAGTLATTDADGTYLVEGLMPGDYVPVAMPMTTPFVGNVADPVPGITAQFYAGANEDTDATVLTLRANEPVGGVDFMLPRRPLATITGQLIAPDGVKLLDDFVAIVSGAKGAPPTWAAALVLPGARFAVSVSPGRYRVDVRAIGTDTERSIGRVFYASAEVEAHEGERIAREFQMVDGTAVAGRVTSDGTGVGGVGIRLVPVSGGQPAVRVVLVTTDADGRFTADALAPTKYALELTDDAGAWALDGVYVEGLRQPDRTIDAGAPADRGATSDIRLVARTASLCGQILGADESVTSNVLILIPADATGNADASAHGSVQLARADRQGAYCFTKQRPGAYTLAMLRNPDPADIRNQAFLDSLRSNSGVAIPVVLSRGVDTRLDLRSR